MKLPQINVIHFQALQRFIQLFQRRAFSAPVKLGHHENLTAVTIFQSLPYALLAYALVVNPKSCPKNLFRDRLRNEKS